MKFRPRRYQCPRCRKKRCCPGCSTLLLIASDVPTDAELTEIKSFWMWDPVKESAESRRFILVRASDTALTCRPTRPHL
jgi:hypothetical protein